MGCKIRKGKKRTNNPTRKTNTKTREGNNNNGKNYNQKIRQINMKKFLNTWYPIIIAFVCMCYSIGLGLSGNTEEALYSAHWAGTILLFSIAIRQRR